MMLKKKCKISDLVIGFFIVLFVLACLLPMLYVLAMSLSSNSAILSSKVFLWPVETTFQSYRTIFADNTMIRSLFLTVELTIRCV